MDRLPHLFEKRRNHSAKRKPKLDRRNAIKNIVYDADASSPLSCPYPPRASRSLDIPASSYRIDGDDGQVERICQDFGFDGPDDFAIPVAAWQARKLRSSSDSVTSRGGTAHLDAHFKGFGDKDHVRIRENSAQLDARLRGFQEYDRDRIRENSDQLDDELAQSEVHFRGFDMAAQSNESCAGVGIENVVISEMSDRLQESVTVSARGGNGINGVRPPHLVAPPPYRPRPLVGECNSSSWDIMRSFAPDETTASSYDNGGAFCSSDDDIDSARRVGETAVLSASCSFTTTSNEDDSSSTTTERTSNVSPNGGFRRYFVTWEKGQLLGRGSFGTVYEGIADGGFFIAVKEVSLLDQGDLGRQSIYQLEQEIALLSRFEHENIVQYYGTDKDEAKLYIFLELMTKGSLLSLYQKYHLRDSQVSAYTRQILHGLKYLHDQNVVHRDIKCANILVDASGLVKLSDFGLAKATKLNDVKSCKGTAFWMAPEVVNLKNQGYGLPADIWSLGCTVLEMLNRQLPYHPLECMQALFRIGRGIPPPIPDSLSKDARDFISQCLQVNPNDRPTAAELLDHPFVKRPLPFSMASPQHPGRRL